MSSTGPSHSLRLYGPVALIADYASHSSQVPA